MVVLVATNRSQAAVAGPSRKQIRKAAKTLRNWWQDPDAPADEGLVTAWTLVSDFRATFQRPLDKVTIQLRHS